MEYLFLTASSLASLAVNAASLFARRSPVARIVAFKLDHLGDLVTAAPALSALRQRFPEAEITLVVGSWCEELAREGLEHDVLAVYDSAAYARRVRTGPASLARLRNSLPHGRFDLAFGLRDDAATLLFCLLGGAVRRRDRGSVRVAYAWERLLARLRGGSAPTLHEIDTNLRIVGGRASGPAPAPVLRVRDDLRRWARDEVLAAWGGARPVVVHPGSAWSYRRWPAERCAELVRRLVLERGVPVVITGSAGERELAESVAFAHPRCRVLAGELGIAQMMGLLSESRLYVGPDTGIMHVAVGVGTPVVALFGPNDPARFGPVGARDAALSAGLECSPCSQRRCSHDGLCMSALGVDEVLGAAARVLDGPAAGEAAAGVAQ
jgi:heptosyltransferase-1